MVRTFFILAVAGTLVIGAGAAWFIFKPESPLVDNLALRPATEIRPPGPFAQPHIEITPDHQLARIQHKDPHGLSPLEMVQTPQGTVTIQRTFATGGTLLKEEAFLDGRSVPVPKR